MTIRGKIIEQKRIPWIMPSTGLLQTTQDGYPLYLTAFLIEKYTGGTVWMYLPIRPNPFAVPKVEWN